MKTALEALKEHSENFWSCADANACQAWTAVERQLIAYNGRQSGKAGRPGVVNADADARYYLGIDDTRDQFYA